MLTSATAEDFGCRAVGALRRLPFFFRMGTDEIGEAMAALGRFPAGDGSVGPAVLWRRMPGGRGRSEPPGQTLRLTATEP